MKTSVSVLAVLTLTSQLVLAETPAETNVTPDGNTVAAGSEAPLAQASAAATDTQIKSLERDLRPSLQSKLDALMDFELESDAHSRGAIASVD